MNLHAYRTTGKYSSMMRKNYDDKESSLPDLILLDSGRKKSNNFVTSCVVHGK